MCWVRRWTAFSLTPGIRLVAGSIFTVLIVSGIQGAFDGVGCKTVIPRKVIGKFSIRIVPNMEPATVERLVVDYLTNLHQQRDSPNTLLSTCLRFSVTFITFWEAGLQFLLFNIYNI